MELDEIITVRINPLKSASTHLVLLADQGKKLRIFTERTRERPCERDQSRERERKKEKIREEREERKRVTSEDMDEKGRNEPDLMKERMNTKN